MGRRWCSYTLQGRSPPPARSKLRDRAVSASYTARGWWGASRPGPSNKVCAAIIQNRQNGPCGASAWASTEDGRSAHNALVVGHGHACTLWSFNLHRSAQTGHTRARTGEHVGGIMADGARLHAGPLCRVMQTKTKALTHVHASRKYDAHTSHRPEYRSVVQQPPENAWRGYQNGCTCNFSFHWSCMWCVSSGAILHW